MKEKRSGGMGLLSGMFLLFLGLKLSNIIKWSWLWVTAPLWAGLALMLIIGMIAVIVILIKKNKP